MENKRVVFSVLVPREGYIDVRASSNEEAIKIVQTLLGDNYAKYVVADVYDVPKGGDQLDLPLDEPDDSEKPKRLN